MSKAKALPTPEDLWNLFLEYKAETKSSPYLIHEFKGGMAKEVHMQKERPLSVLGFKRFGYYRNLTIDHYWNNSEKAYDEYRTIIARIDNEIKSDQIEGGMAGVYDRNLTARLNNLVERVQEDGSKEITIKVIRGDRNKTE